MDKDQDKKPDELEQKISEAEMEAQEDDASAEEAAGSSFETEVAEPEDSGLPPSKMGLSKARKIWRRILVWLVVIAIAFAGGFFLDTQLRYLPQVGQTNQLQNDLGAADAKIGSLESEIERLSQFEDQNAQLVEQMDQLKVHLTLLSARAAVADASLAIEQERTADAKLELQKAGTALGDLKDLVTADQAEVVDNMLQRHNLIMIELENDGYSVQTDLELLTTRLITLENNLFAAP